MASSSSSSLKLELETLARDPTKQASKQWSNTSWYLLEMIRSGELCNSLIHYDLARVEFNSSDTLIVATTTRGRSKQYHGFALGSLKDDVFELHEICSKPGGGSALIQALIQHALTHSCKVIHLDSVASSIIWYRNRGFQLARVGTKESKQIAQLADRFRHTRFTSFKDAIADADYVVFLQRLIKSKLARSSTAKTLEECDETGGYSMVYYLPRPSSQKKRKRHTLETME